MRNEDQMADENRILSALGNWRVWIATYFSRKSEIGNAFAWQQGGCFCKMHI